MNSEIFMILTAGISAISEAMAITYPNMSLTLTNKFEKEQESLEIEVPELSISEKVFLYTSFSYFILLPFLILSDNPRFIGYAVFNISMMFIGKIFKDNIIEKPFFVRIISSIQLFILIDIIRSSYFSTLM
jgi:hypothetical protein